MKLFSSVFFFFCEEIPFNILKETKLIKCPGLQRIPNTPSQRHRGESFLYPGQIDEDHNKI